MLPALVALHKPKRIGLSIGGHRGVIHSLTHDTYLTLKEILARRALSNEVITPGKTRLGDVRRWLYDALAAPHGVGTWFQPDLRVQREGMETRPRAVS